MWDLYRSQARDDIAEQYGEGQENFAGVYLGTLTLSSNGDVGFTTTAPIPEPGTWAAAAIAAALIGAGSYRRLRRRGAVVAA
jgi:hypothetical protein